VVQFIQGTRIKWPGHVCGANGSMLKGSMTNCERKTMEMMEKQCQGIIRRHLSELGAGK